MPCVCIFLPEWRINWPRQSLFQFHPDRPVHSRTTPSRMLQGWKEAAALHNQFLSLFLSLVMTCEEELLSQPCTFSSSSWEGRERPKGETLTKHSKTIPNCQKQRYSGLEANQLMLYDCCQERFCWDVLGLCWDIWVKQASSYLRGLLPYTGCVAAGTISEFTQEHFNTTSAKKQGANNSIQWLAMLF